MDGFAILVLPNHQNQGNRTGFILETIIESTLQQHYNKLQIWHINDRSWLGDAKDDGKLGAVTYNLIIN